MAYPDKLKYTNDHEWIKVEEDPSGVSIATIGVTDFAQRELGDIVYVEIETLNEKLDKETAFGTIEAVKTVSDLYMPISGTVKEINEALNSMGNRLHALELQKSSFIRHISHELKTPLAAIREGTELLYDNSVGSLNNDQQEITKIIRNSTR